MEEDYQDVLRFSTGSFADPLPDEAVTREHRAVTMPTSALGSAVTAAAASEPIRVSGTRRVASVRLDGEAAVPFARANRGVGGGGGGSGTSGRIVDLDAATVGATSVVSDGESSSGDSGGLFVLEDAGPREVPMLTPPPKSRGSFGRAFDNAEAGSS